jgi:hypothetical protein
MYKYSKVAGELRRARGQLTVIASFRGIEKQQTMG